MVSVAMVSGARARADTSEERTLLLQGKVAIVSGAGEGLGRSICRRFAEEGATVVLADLREEAVQGSVAAVEALGGTAVGVTTDITDPTQCAALVDRAVGDFGRVDILVNDAYHGGDFSLFEHAELEAWKATAEVNVWGTLRLTQAALPALKASGEGRIVMICTHGVELIQPTFGAYTGSKASIAHLTKLLATELGQYGIRVNAVFPGPIWGPALEGYLTGQAEQQGITPQEAFDGFASMNALHYLVSPDEIAASVTFFASDMARPVTGQALYVNAGEICH